MKRETSGAKHHKTRCEENESWNGNLIEIWNETEKSFGVEAWVGWMFSTGKISWIEKFQDGFD